MTSRFLSPVLLALCLPLLATAQALALERDQPLQRRVTQRGPHHRVIEHTVREESPFGAQERAYRVTELATAMHYLPPGSREWVEASDQIEITSNGARASRSQHAVQFRGNLNSPSAVTITTPSGQMLRTSLLGLSYQDASGKSVLLAEVKDCDGELLPSGNEVVFPEAFDSIHADVLYVNHVWGMEQIIVFREALPDAATLGLDPETTMVQVLTEFLDRPVPRISRRVTSGDYDEHMAFDGMEMGKGVAFALGVDAPKVKVRKIWGEFEGRTILVEEVPLAAAAPVLEKLSPSGSGSAAVQQRRSFPLASHKRVLPPRPGQLAPAAPVRLAKADLPNSGFALDYTIVTSQDSLTLTGWDSYYLVGTVNVNTLIVDPNAVIKVTNSPSATIIVASNVVWKTKSWAPAVFSAKDDNTVGDAMIPLPGSTGNPSARYYGGVCLDLSRVVNPVVSNARFSYMSNALAASEITLENVQMLQCYRAIAPGCSSATLRNVLLYRLHTFLGGDAQGGDIVRAENLTAHYCTNFVADASPQTLMTNSLLVCVTNWWGSQSAMNYSAALNSDAGVFQVVGSGRHYLVPSSPYRDVGTPDIDPGLLNELRSRTTYPPIVYSNATISADTTFGPQAQRDLDQIDLGFHYHPLDYVFGGVTANAHLKFTAGTSIGWFRTTSGDTRTAVFEGTAEAPCYWVRFNTVQEGGPGPWAGHYGPGGITGWAATRALSPKVTGRFLRCSVLGGEGGAGNHVRDDYGYLIVQMRDCEYIGGGFGGYVTSQQHTNCLFRNTSASIESGNADNFFTFRNCTWHSGQFRVNRYTGTRLPVSVRDCVFEGTDVSVQDPLVNDPTVTDYDYNAFLTTAPANRPTGPNDVLVSAFNWQSGPSGDFYLPTNSPLIDAGSASAGAIGLYHHTTQTNQTKEGASRIDIGFHSLAANQNGLPLDSDGDGIPDYIEDLDGDGLVDSGETDWGNADTDYDGITDYDELEGQTDPLDPDSFTSVQLAHFKFDAPNWAGEESQLPRAAHNVDQPDTWSGKGVQITSRQYSYLAYKDHEANGQPNINLRRGTVRFWFKPDWSSTTAGGTGPQTWARLVEMGRYDPTWGRWVIGLHPNGTSLEFSATAASGSPAQTMLLHPISWTVGQWHQIAVTYGPEGSVLYIDGVPVRSGSGVQHWPSLAQRQALGLMIGNDGHISQPAKGTFEELETFNYQLTEPEIWAGFSDGDELPDIWEYSHFGSLGQDGSGDYDNDGTTNLDEYLAETNPNTIAFSLTVTNSYVGTSLTALQLKIDHGIPFKYAVLVDPTNTELAEWSPCTSLDVPVNLGSVEGWHEVWVGLRGHPETSEQIWERKNVKLDLTPPMLVITSPESTLVSQPMIQLTGYSAEPLSSISCTVSNAAGIFANQMIYVLRQHYDTNSHELTTNTFQAFDLELTNGLNTITLSAADLAGNLTTPNVDFTVVNDTEAPVVSLYWPQNGAILCGETFTWRGGVDDFTASVTISTSDSGGQTSEIIALVERDGRFWAEEIPLFAGANFLTLTATDAWGNQASTNIQVVKSEIGLTIDSVTSDLNEPRVTVTGAIVSAGYSVWVNGVKATDNGGGAWTAEYVPLPRGGTPVIQARAIPNTDNGGNGTGGGGGTSSSYEEPGNPASAQAQDAEAQPEGQQGICLESDTITWELYSRREWEDIFEDWFVEIWQQSYGHAWLEGYGGGGARTLTIDETLSPSFSSHCEAKVVYDWPESLSMPGYQVTTVSGAGDCEEEYWPGEGPVGSPSICWQHCKVTATDDQMWVSPVDMETWHDEFYKVAQTTLLLRTGGKAVPGRKNLWVITGGAEKILDHWEALPCGPNVPRQGIPPEQVTIGALGTLGSDGRLYKVLPDGASLDATAVVKGVDYYTFNAGGTKHKLVHETQCAALGNPDPARTDLGVGEYVNFRFEPPLLMTFPEKPWWLAFDGSISPSSGEFSTYTAPSNAATALVRVFVQDAQLDTYFNVLEPTGIAKTDFRTNTIGEPDLDYPGLYVSGAGMKLCPYLAPTHVSFYRIELMEVGEDASQVTGYYADPEKYPDPSKLSHKGGPGQGKGDEWFGINCDNSWKTPWDYAFWMRDQPPWSKPGQYEGGSFTWNIPGVWTIDGGNTVHPLSSWSQRMTLGPDGSMTIEKLGRTIKRNIFDQYEIIN